MAETYEAPVRVDSNSKPVDNRWNFLLGPNLPTAALGVADGGSSSIGTNTGPLSQLASFVGANATGRVTFSWTTQSNSDEYFVEYWLLTNPNSRSGVVVTGSSVTVGPVASGTVVQAKARACVKYGRGDWSLGAFSSVSSGTGQ